MAPKYHPDHVRLMLSYAAPSTGLGDRTIHLEAEFADSGDSLFRIVLTPGQFTNLMASRTVVARSAVEVPRGPGPTCQETNSEHGDCDGRVREYTVTAADVCGQLRGESVLLCANHAQYHGPRIVMTHAVGVR